MSSQSQLPVQDGLIHALKLNHAGLASSMETLEAAEGTWLHFDAGQPSVTEWLSEHGGLNAIAVGALTSEETRPRVLRRGDNVVVHCVVLTASQTRAPRIWCLFGFGRMGRAL